MAADAGGHQGTNPLLCQQLQNDIQGRFGFAVQAVWLQQILSQLQQEDASYAQQPRTVQLQLILEQLLMADFRQAGAGGLLPPNLKASGIHVPITASHTC